MQSMRNHQIIYHLSWVILFFLAFIFGCDNTNQNNNENEMQTEEMSLVFPGNDFPTELIVNEEGLKIRKNPSIRSEIIQELQKNDELEFLNMGPIAALNYQPNFWVHVRYDGEQIIEGYVWGEFVEGPAMEAFNELPLWNYYWYREEEAKDFTPEDFDLIKYFKNTPPYFSFNRLEGLINYIIPPNRWKFEIFYMEFPTPNQIQMTLKTEYGWEHDYTIQWENYQEFKMPFLDIDGPMEEITYVGIEYPFDDILRAAEIAYANTIKDKILGTISQNNGNARITLKEDGAFTVNGISSTYDGQGHYVLHPAYDSPQMNQQVPVITFLYGINIDLRFYQIIDQDYAKFFKVSYEGENITLKEGNIDEETLIFTEQQDGLLFQGTLESLESE